MRTEPQNNKRNLRDIRSRFFAFILVLVLLVQTMAMSVGAIADQISPRAGGGSSSTSPSGIVKLDVDGITAQLKKDLIKSLNQELVKKVSDYELKGSVGLIITFSDDSLVSAYTRSGYANVMTYEEFKDSKVADQYKNELLANQNRVLSQLTAEGLVNDVRYNYVHIADGAFVKTTYDMIEKISKVDGVERIMLSNTYLPAAAVENPVDVYDTGIFNSGSVSYTGKNTVVAILDTGCDYSHSAFTSYTVVDPFYDRDEIAALLPGTQAYALNGGLEAREVYYGNLTGNKIAFGYDYADKDPDVMPFENSHGTHVAGIIAGKDDTITGVAVDAQLAIMKVFSDYDSGAEEGDIIAALEDAIILGVDAINMSLGASCGFTYESAPDKEYKNEVYGRIEEAGISLVVAASNDFSSGFGSSNGNTNKTENPDSATVGSPSTYNAAMSVASINGNKDNYMLANGKDEIFFTPSVNTASKEYDFFAMLGIGEGDSVVYDYVTVPGVGRPINYAGIDVNGKIALVRRGDITFEEKVQYAAEAGAIAVIVYNNVFGDLTMTIGNDAKIPAVFIGKDEGDLLAAQEVGTLTFDLKNVAGPFMSDFSSWGPNPDLSLKPEITAHGGNIVSAIVGGEYDKMSGTSMAAPNMCGITVLIRQYVKETFPELSVTEVRDLVNQLTMSTATIALDRKGNPYSPRKQGAGIADIAKSTTTPAYLYVDGINKTKLELGDDPTRSGVYTMSVNLKNISDRALSYRLGNITMTESVSASDPEYVAEMAYLLSNTSKYEVEGGTLANGVVTVAAGATAKVTVTITLSAADKSYLNSTFENGMYVEGYLTFESTEEKGVDLNAPFLAFYGDWSEAPIFDIDYYEVETEAHNDAIDDDDKIKADYYATTPLGSYYYDYILPLGSYVYTMAPGYTAIPATMDKAAISYYSDCISGIYGVFTGLLRGAKEMSIQIVDTSTGEVVWEDIQYNCYKAHYNGSPYPYACSFNLPTVNYETYETLGNNNSKFEVTMSAKLDWDGGNNISDTYSFSFYIDYEAPTIVNYKYRVEYDKSLKKDRYYVDLTVFDNHYAMSVRPIAVYETYDPSQQGNVLTYSPIVDYPIPIYQENRGENTLVSFEITDYLDVIASSKMSSGLTLYIDDYAMNASICYIPFDDTDKDIDFVEMETPLELSINETADLTEYFVYADGTPVTSKFLNTLTWISSDESVVDIHQGKIEALKAGTATISVTSDSWVVKTEVNESYVNVPQYKHIKIIVTENVITDNPESSDHVEVNEIGFLSYETLFAFNSDIDYSDIGSTGSIHYFDGSYNISCYPSEKVQLNPYVDPWNLRDYKLSWSSSNPKVATVDKNGVVTAEAKGNAKITLKITTKDGSTSFLTARLNIEVKSEFIVENRTLVAYKGKGGHVVIPDDEGIMYIGDFAFSHYDLDNEKPVEKDENGYYDMDEKKSAIGNDTVVSVVIPEGVEAINKYAFYNCTKLSKVVLPSTCKTIGAHAFENSVLLEEVNFDHVKIVSDYAFSGCASLRTGGESTKEIYTVGDYGFAGTRFASLTLTRLSRIGVGAFSGCAQLKSVTLGAHTRVAEKMFEKCGLTSITIYGDSIADEAFAECFDLATVVIANDITYLGVSAFKDCKKLSSVTFGAGVEQIASGAFMGCKKLTTLTLPNGSIRIGDDAFANSGLTTLKLSANTELPYLGIALFRGFESNVTIDTTLSNLYITEGGAIYNATKDTLVYVLPSEMVTTFTVPACVKNIGSGAFSSLKKLKSVYFETGSLLQYIGENAFADCSVLSIVDLPSNYIAVDHLAFYATNSLKNINLSKVTELGEYAFSESAIKEANLSSVTVIGGGAFYDATVLSTVTLADGAVIGDFAFSYTGVKTVELLGDATIGYAAFMGATNLTYFDFADVTGKIDDYAFYQCYSLASVIAPKITEIGESAFSDCFALTEFSAESLKVLGASVFAPLNEEATYANLISEVNLPLLEQVGNYAFYGMRYLTSLDISGVKTIRDEEGNDIAIGEGAFALCDYLTEVTLSPELEEIPAYAFYNCPSLSDIDLSKVVKIGEGAFYGVTLPATLNLDNAEHIDGYAFIEGDNNNNLVTLNAPKLKYLGDQAFAGSLKLENVNAPALESIGYGAFAYTAIVELEISNSLKNAGLNIFEGSSTFKAFYVLVDGEKVYDIELDNVIIDGDAENGSALYVKSDKGYILTTYPMAKLDTEYSVLEGTVRVEFGAALGNKYLEKVVLPTTLKYIGNYAFDSCSALNTVVFKSYYAPVLEGTMTGSNAGEEINYGNASDYTKFDLLYKYDYYYVASGVVSAPLYYNTFKGMIASKDADGLVAVLPKNCSGYDNLLYRAFFGVSADNAGVTSGKYAVDFMDIVNKLPANVDRFDKLLVDAAVTAYNALMAHSDEIMFVDEAYFTAFEAARSRYNVDFVTDKIAHLYDMDKLEYTFNKVKEAKKAYDALSASDKALITNASVLDEKIAELNTIYGKVVDFSLSYQENVGVEEAPTEPGDNVEEPKDGMKTWVIVLIVVGSVAVLAGGAFVVIYLLRKNKLGVAKTSEDSSEDDGDNN